MKFTKEKIKEIIAEELQNEILENTMKEISLNPFDWFKKDEPKEAPASEPAADEEPEEEEDHRYGICRDEKEHSRAEDMWPKINRVLDYVNGPRKRLQVAEWENAGPGRLFRAIANEIEGMTTADHANVGAFAKLAQYGSYEKFRSEIDFRYIGSLVWKDLDSSKTYRFGDGPCISGRNLNSAISWAFGAAAGERKEAPKFEKPQRDVDHLLSRHEGKVRQTVEDVLREMLKGEED